MVAKLNKILILLSILLSFVAADLCNTTDTDDCATCCVGSDGSKVCTTDILKCSLNPSTDFSVLVQIIIVLAAFIIGIPFGLFIIDKVFCTKIAAVNMSICECIAIYICPWCCQSRDKPPQEFEDIEEAEVLDKKKQAKPAGAEQ